MNRTGVGRFAAVSIALTLALGVCVTPAAQADSGSVNEQDETGARIWRGEPSEDLEVVSDGIARFVGEHMDLFGGSALVSDSTRVEVYVAPGGEEHVPRMRDAVGPEAFDALATTVSVEHSLTDLLAAQRALSDAGVSGRGAAVIAPSMTRNAIVVEYPEPELRAIEEALGGLEEFGLVETPAYARLVGASLDPSVRVYLAEGYPGEHDGTRRNDSQPFYGGAQLDAQGAYCSLGVRILRGGVRYALTAGHCAPDQSGPQDFYNASGGARYVGTTHTTAYPGNAHLYGDWKLLKNPAYPMSGYAPYLTARCSTG